MYLRLQVLVFLLSDKGPEKITMIFIDGRPLHLKQKLQRVQIHENKDQDSIENGLSCGVVYFYLYTVKLTSALDSSGIIIPFPCQDNSNDFTLFCINVTGKMRLKCCHGNLISSSQF